SAGIGTFSGKTAFYSGAQEYLDDGAGHIMQPGIPLAVCDKTAGKLAERFPEEIMTTDSTWYYDGGGCC
ncbi:MAG: SAM-dependent methyltransferase, partial [Cyanobacteria bacterium J06629_9]